MKQMTYQQARAEARTDGAGGRVTGGAARMAAVLAVAVAIAVGLIGCGVTGERLDPTAGVPGSSPATPASPDATGDPGGAGDPPAGEAGSGSGNGEPSDGTGSGGSGDGGGSGEAGNVPPYIRDLYPEAYQYGTGAERVIAADMSGHAYDPDGPDSQQAVARVEIDWGDGNATDASLEGHGAFRAYYDYDLSYAGTTMTVRVVAHGHDGQTAAQTVYLALPEE